MPSRATPAPSTLALPPAPAAGHHYALGLGSNLGSRCATLALAVHLLARDPDLHLEAVASLYHSPALGPPQPDYLNTALTLRTTLPPQALLERTQRIEASCGRRRGRRWGARTLDIDILASSLDPVDNVTLRLPHPAVRQRAFVWWPLAEVWPAWTSTHPPNLPLPAPTAISPGLDLWDTRAWSLLTRVAAPAPPQDIRLLPWRDHPWSPQQAEAQCRQADTEARRSGRRLCHVSVLVDPAQPRHRLLLALGAAMHAPSANSVELSERNPYYGTAWALFPHAYRLGAHTDKAHDPTQRAPRAPYNDAPARESMSKTSLGESR